MTIDTKTSAEKAHAKFSASGSERWLNCPGSVVLSESVPERPSNSYAEEGTRAHECLELLLKNENQLAAAKNMALKKYPLEMVEYAMDAVFWITDRVEKGDELLCETEVRLDFIEPDMFGTLDAAIVRHFGRLTVIDYKYGSGLSVEPSYNDDLNSQLAYYALGIAHLYDFNFSEVELVIIQPRAFRDDGETTRSAVFPIEKLLTWEKKFRDGVARANELMPDYKAGSWCRFCPAAIKCPELKDNSLKEAQIVFSDEQGLITLPPPVLINGQGLTACDKLETWIDAYRKAAIGLLEKGADLDGWKLVQKRGIRRWINEDEIKVKYGKGALAPQKVLSPAQFEKANPNQDISKFVTSESSGVTLVPASDKRPAVRSIDQVFDELP